MIDIREYTELMVNTELSCTQTYFCFLIYERDITAINKFIGFFGAFNKEFVDVLVEKDFIIQMVPKSYQLSDLIVTNKFTRHFVVEEEEQGEEFWKAFPDWLLINDRKVASKATDKDKLISDYIKAIKKSLSQHKVIMNILVEYKRLNMGWATMSIQKFVSSRHWEQLTELFGQGYNQGGSKEL